MGGSFNNLRKAFFYVILLCFRKSLGSFGLRNNSLGEKGQPNRLYFTIFVQWLHSAFPTLFQTTYDLTYNYLVVPAKPNYENACQNSQSVHNRKLLTETIITTIDNN